MENISAYDGRVISEYVLDNEKRLTFEEVVDLLNSLVDENEQLRQSISKTILDFCNWLGGQGLAYETIYYGEEKDIERLINKYIETKCEEYE